MKNNNAVKKQSKNGQRKTKGISYEDDYRNENVKELIGALTGNGIKLHSSEIAYY